MGYIIIRGELLLYTPVVVRSNRIPPPCVFATQDSTRKDSTQTFNIKSHDHELAHIRAREVQTHIIMANEINATVQNAAQVASTNETLTEGTQKKFAVKVNRLQVFEDSDIVNIQLIFDKSFPGFVKDDNGDFVAAETNAVSLSRSGLTRMLCEHDESIAMLRDGQSSPLTRAQLAVLLHGSSLTITRTFHAAGFIPEGREPLTRNQWFTDIDSIKLTEVATSMIQKVILDRMMNA